MHHASFAFSGVGFIPNWFLSALPHFPFVFLVVSSCFLKSGKKVAWESMEKKIEENMGRKQIENDCCKEAWIKPQEFGTQTIGKTPYEKIQVMLWSMWAKKAVWFLSIPFPPGAVFWGDQWSASGGRGRKVLFHWLKCPPLKENWIWNSSTLNNIWWIDLFLEQMLIPLMYQSSFVGHF